MAAPLLAGCSSHSAMNPVNWWHSLEGGKIAEERPPPPKDNAPYPNLATVPAKPSAPDRVALDALSASLVADRANAQHIAETTPLADPSNPGASPALFGRGTAAPPTPPAAPGAVAVGVPSGQAQTGAHAETPVAAAVPMPETPPPPPDLPGVPRTTAPTQTLAQSDATKGVTVEFGAASAILTPSAGDLLKLLASHRGNGRIAVVGYGDATAIAPDAQSASLALALSRARAVAAALAADGVPASAISVDAEAIGRGATARLIQ